MNFKEWLIEQEIQEGWKDWLAGGLVGATALGTAAGLPLGHKAYRHLDPKRPGMMKTLSQWDKDVKSPRRLASRQFWEFGPWKTYKIRTKGEAAKIEAAKDWAKDHFHVSDEDIHVVKASDYLKGMWGDDWEEVLQQAKTHPGRKAPWIPDVERLDDPIVLVRSDDPTEKGTHGTCRIFGTGKDAISVCSVIPGHWGHTPSSREELTHAMQGDVQGRIGRKYEKEGLADLLNYTAQTEEFSAKLAELKRQYYQHTGKIAQDAKELFNWGVRNYDDLPSNVKTVIIFYSNASGREEEKIIDFANSILGGLVKTKAPSVGDIV